MPSQERPEEADARAIVETILGIPLTHADVEVIERPDGDTLTICMTSSLTNIGNTISIALSTTTAALPCATPSVARRVERRSRQQAR